MGVREAPGPGGALFCGRGRGAVRRTHEGGGGAVVGGGVAEAPRGFAGTAPPFDDITMLALRWLDALPVTF